MLAAFLILSFYSEVVAWVFAYILKAMRGSILSSDPQVTEAAFNALISDPLQSLLWQWGVLVFIGGILLLGVTKGIEGLTKKLMPLLFLLLLLLCAVSLSLDKAAEGLAFLFQPRFQQNTASVVLTAMGLAFFKLSIGMGTMMTYGSYFRRRSEHTGDGLAGHGARTCACRCWPASRFFRPCLPLVLRRRPGRRWSSSRFRRCFRRFPWARADGGVFCADRCGRHRRHAVADGSAGADSARTFRLVRAPGPR